MFLCLQYLLQHRLGFNDIRILREDSPNPANWPTRHNIFTAFAWLLSAASAGDSFVFTSQVLGYACMRLLL